MIGIVDYGLGNINAFATIYKRLNIPCQLIKVPSDFEGVNKVILPGVGAFDSAMAALNKSGLREALDENVLVKKKPVLGVCVGMQMMADKSEEGCENGLAWIPGSVKKIKTDLPLPHMGWNTLTTKKEAPIFSGLVECPRFYFLHSYYMDCSQEENILAKSDYDANFCSAVKSKNIYGIQCHPEKSHEAGTVFLKNFAEISC
jgi:imidazole glycerol-phosphate synthase subunit HisH